MAENGHEGDHGFVDDDSIVVEFKGETAIAEV
jgi:hypothetical protein